jgi:hypothetical protein
MDHNQGSCIQREFKLSPSQVYSLSLNPYFHRFILSLTYMLICIFSLNLKNISRLKTTFRFHANQSNFTKFTVFPLKWNAFGSKNPMLRFFQKFGHYLRRAIGYKYIKIEENPSVEINCHRF